MSEPTNDERNSKQLGIHVSVIGQTRNRYNEDPIIHHILKDRIEQQIEERRTKLETAIFDDIPKIQGQISGLRSAIAAIEQTI